MATPMSGARPSDLIRGLVLPARRPAHEAGHDGSDHHHASNVTFHGSSAPYRALPCRLRVACFARCCSMAETDEPATPWTVNSGAHTFFHVLSGLNSFMARAMAALFGPRSFWYTTPS